MHGLPGIHFVAIANTTSTVKRREDGSLERVMPNVQSSQEVYNDLLALGFDAVNSFGKPRAEMIYGGRTRRLVQKALRKLFPQLPAVILDYPKAMRHFYAPEDAWENVYPSLMPGWDRSPRAGNYDGVFVNSTPAHFKQHIVNALQLIADKQPQHRILFLRSWNEWGEGNYVEPDQKYGHGFLDALKDTIR